MISKAIKERENETNLGVKLRRVRDHLGLSRPPFAKILGIPATTLKNYELCYRGKVPLSVLCAFYSSPRLRPFVSFMLDANQAAESLSVQPIKRGPRKEDDETE